MAMDANGALLFLQCTLLVMHNGGGSNDYNIVSLLIGCL